MTIKKNNRILKKLEILKCAAGLAALVGYTNLTRENVATAAFTSPALINFYFKSMENLKKEVLQYAIDNEVVPIVMQGLGLKTISRTQLSDRLRGKITDQL